MGANMESAILHLNSIKCELSSLKSNIFEISNKLEDQQNIFVSHKSSPKYESLYKEHIHSFDIFFNNVNQEVFSANLKIAHLEMETNSLTLILEEGHVLQSNKLELIKVESLKKELEQDDSSLVTENETLCALENDEFVAEEREPDSSIKKSKTSKKKKLRFPRESVKVKTSFKINYESFDDEAATELDYDSTIDSDKIRFSETEELFTKDMLTNENINLTDKNIDNAKVVCQNDPENFQCKKCSAKYPKLRILHMHIIEKHTMSYFQMFKCEICSIKYTEIDALLEHKKVEHEKQYPFECSQCGQRFTDKISLNSHSDNVHKRNDNEVDSSEAGENKYRCNLCNKVYVSQHNLRRHKRVHTEEFFECPLCKREYKDSSELRRHYFLHIEKKLKCPYCNKKQSNKTRLRSHMSKKHGFKFISKLTKSTINTSQMKRQMEKTPTKEEQSTHVEEMSESDESGISDNSESSKDNKMCHSQLKCQFCPQQFRTRSQYINHRKTHNSWDFGEISPSEESRCISNFDIERIVAESDGSIRHVCKICNKSFPIKSNAERHLLTHISDRPYQCEICEMSFRDPTDLKKHSQKHSNGTIKDQSTKVENECEKTDNSSSSKSSQATFPKNPLKCQRCSEKFKSRPQYIKHLKSRKCLDLSQTSPNEEDELISKMELETIVESDGNLTHMCKICGKYFSMKSNGERHLLTHIGDLPYECEICAIRMSEISSLKKHYYRKHNIGQLKGKTFPCTICSKEFNTSMKLKYHMSIHTGEKPYQCTVCGNCFSHPSNLKSHMLIHKGIKPHQCQLCPNRTYTKNQLKWHMIRTHLKVKKHTCEYCGSCFSEKGHLTRHIRIHTDERPYKCDWCQKAFRSSKCLKEHTGMHTGVRYTCQVCGKSYARKYGLRLHEKNSCGKLPVTIDPH